MEELKQLAIKEAKGHVIFAGKKSNELWEIILNPLKNKIRNEKKKRDATLVSSDFILKSITPCNVMSACRVSLQKNKGRKGQVHSQTKVKV
jgi:hypothetical protein